MVHSSSTLVPRCLVLCRSTSRCVLVSPLVAVLLGCLWVTPGAVVGIVAKFATLETAIGLNWGSCIVVLGRCVHGASLMILLLDTRPLTGLGVASLLVLVLIVPLTLLSRALCLIVVVPTLVSGAELRTLGVFCRVFLLVCPCYFLLWSNNSFLVFARPIALFNKV
jgi:hypothetical protein